MAFIAPQILGGDEQINTLSNVQPHITSIVFTIIFRIKMFESRGLRHLTMKITMTMTTTINFKKKYENAFTKINVGDRIFI